MGVWAARSFERASAELYELLEGSEGFRTPCGSEAEASEANEEVKEMFKSIST